MLDNKLLALQPIQRKPINTERHLLFSESKQSATCKFATQAWVQGGGIETQNKAVSSKRLALDNVLSSHLNVDGLSTSLSEEASPSKRPCFTRLANEEKIMHLDSTQVSSPESIRNGNNSVGLPMPAIKISHNLHLGESASLKNGKSQSFLCRPKLCMKQHDLCMMELLSKGEINNCEDTSSENKQANAPSTCFIEHCTVGPLERDIHDDGIEPEGQEDLTNAINIRKRETLQTQAISDSISNLPEERNCKVPSEHVILDQDIRREDQEYLSNTISSQKSETLWDHDIGPEDQEQLSNTIKGQKSETVWDHDVGPEDQEHLSISIKNETTEIQTVNEPIVLLSEKEESRNPVDLCLKKEKNDSTELFDQKFKNLSRDDMEIKDNGKKFKLGVDKASNMQAFQAADQMDRHQMNKVDDGYRESRKQYRRDTDRLAGYPIKQKMEFIDGSEQEYLKEDNSLQNTRIIKKHHCLRDDANVVKKGTASCDVETLEKRRVYGNDILVEDHSMVDHIFLKEVRLSHKCNISKEDCSLHDCNVPKKGRNLGDKEYHSSHNYARKTSNSSDKNLSNNMHMLKRDISSPENDIQRSKPPQERCISIKKPMKPMNTLEKEQSKQDLDLNRQASRGLIERRPAGRAIATSGLASTKSSLQKNLPVVRKQKTVGNKEIDNDLLQRVNQTRDDEMPTGKLTSWPADATPRRLALLKSGLKKRVESIGREALAEPGLREKVRNIAKTALCEAGFKIELRPRKSRDYRDSVYVAPNGQTYWSLPKAWRALKEIQANKGRTGDIDSTVLHDQNRVHKSDVKVADIGLNCTVAGKRKQDLGSNGKELFKDCKVLRALKLSANRDSHQEVTNAELSDLFIEDLKLFKRVTKKSRTRMAEDGTSSASDRPIKEVEVRGKMSASSSFLSKKLDFDKANRHEGTSRKHGLVSSIAATDGRRKRQKTEDCKVNNLKETCLYHVRSSGKKPSKKVDDTDAATDCGIKYFQQRKEKKNDLKFSKQRKDNSKGIVLKKHPSEAASNEGNSSPEKQWMNAPIGELIRKVNRKGASPLTKLTTNEWNVSHEKLHTSLQVTQENKASYRRLKHTVSSIELNSSKKRFDKDKSIDSDSIISKSKTVCSDLLPLKSKKSKHLSGKEVAPHLKPAQNQGMRSGFRLEVWTSTSRKGEGSDSGELKNKQTVLSWLIERRVLSERERLHCLAGEGHQIVKRGLATSDGILCKCCRRIFTISDFKAHAGSKYKGTHSSIILKSGKSLLDCQMQAWKVETQLRKVKNYVGVTYDDTNDDTCMLCGDGGELICCDHCPSTFHTSCLQIENVPEGNWYCPKCCCHVCGRSQYDDKGESTRPIVHFCEQCEHEYHASCIEGGGVFTEDHWFCRHSCEKIFTGLRSLIGISHVLDGGLSWTLLRCMEKDEGMKISEGLETLVTQHCKLAVALNVMQECFVPMVDPRTNVDMIPHVVFNRWSEFYRLDYRGFYTVLLEKGDEIISVASIRIHGSRVAEMPLIGTRQQYRRQGMCRRLVTAIETMLSSLGIELFVLPAIPELLQTWTCAFGFDPIDTANKRSFKQLSMMVFPGTQLLQKALVKKDQVMANTDAAIGHNLQPLEPLSCLPVLLEYNQEPSKRFECAGALLTEEQCNTDCHKSLSKKEANESLDIAEINTEHSISLSSREAEGSLDMENRKYIEDIRSCDMSVGHSNGNAENKITVFDKVEKAATGIDLLQLDQREKQSVTVDNVGLER